MASATSFHLFFISPIFNMPDYIWNGRMDYVLQKPLHPLVALMATSEVVISNLPNLVINLILAAWFLGRASPVAMPGVWFLFGALILVGIAVRYALALFCMAPAFYAGTPGRRRRWVLVFGGHRAVSDKHFPSHRGENPSLCDPVVHDGRRTCGISVWSHGSDHGDGLRRRECPVFPGCNLVLQPGFEELSVSQFRHVSGVWFACQSLDDGSKATPSAAATKIQKPQSAAR
jgi:hypothetical protein